MSLHRFIQRKQQNRESRESSESNIIIIRERSGRYVAPLIFVFLFTRLFSFNSTLISLKSVKHTSKKNLVSSVKLLLLRRYSHLNDTVSQFVIA